MVKTDFLSRCQNLPQGHCEEVSVALGRVEMQGGENRDARDSTQFML